MPNKEDLIKENEELKHTNRQLTEKYNNLYARAEKLEELLIRARAQLQYFKDAAKNDYMLTLNMKEI